MPCKPLDYNCENQGLPWDHIAKIESGSISPAAKHVQFPVCCCYLQTAIPFFEVWMNVSGKDSEIHSCGVVGGVGRTEAHFRISGH
jgi:hypothetical protein